MLGMNPVSFSLPPDVKLNLTMEAIVGIYNGSITNWNDTQIAYYNYNIKLPDARIKAVARADDSGSTEIFTSYLARSSPEWNDTYGVFSQGNNVTTDQHDIWNLDCVQYFGKTNRAMSGIILSYKYSIGYLSVADAVVAQLPYANIVDQDGHIQQLIVDNMQKAMDRSLQDLRTEIILNLADYTRDGEYPIIGYSYFLIHMDRKHDCESTTEFVRFIEWCMESSFARLQAQQFNMGPLPASVENFIVDNVLKMMKCRGDDLYKMVQDQKNSEWWSKQTWKIPVMIATPLVAFCLIALVVYIIVQQFKLRRSILSDDWNIPSYNIKLRWSKRWGPHNNSPNTEGSSTSIAISALSAFSFAPTLNVIALGHWNDQTVCLRDILFPCLSIKKTEVKKSINWMRDKVHHINILRFFGVTQIGNEQLLVSEYAPKGSLSDVVQNDKYNIDENMKFSMALDIASGMSFLHSQSLVHGLLTPECCCIDQRWNVKISDWEHHRLETLSRGKR